jgi:uncharacterized protein (DUF1501 family)
MLTRRDFLRHSSLAAFAPAVPLFVARTAKAAGTQRDSRVLVVVQLDGGNDGINTVVPHADEGYAKHRKQLRLVKNNLVKINDSLGLHPAMQEAGKLLEAGKLCIVQGVGYPNPSRSHFESMAVWQTARRDTKEHAGPGWLGRAMDASKVVAGGAPSMVLVGGGQLPVALRSRRSVASSLTRPEDFLLAPEARGAVPAADEAKDDLTAFVQRMAIEAGATAERMKGIAARKDSGPAYPDTELAQHLRLVARLIKAEAGTRVFYTRQGGYDTHSAQFGTHFQLLSALSGGLKAFIDDLTAAKLADRVVVLVFSEFGRTVKENGSAGTDHGTAGVVLLAGAGLRGPLAGSTPSLTELDPKHGDLKVGVDFRRVYATVLEDWLCLPAQEVVGKGRERLDLFQAGA